VNDVSYCKNCITLLIAVQHNFVAFFLTIKLKMTTMKTIKIFFAIALIAMAVSSCKKSGTSTMTMRMTDGPGDFTAVYIDLQSVVVTGPGGDVTLNTHAGVYNLLNFADGVDTIIATGGITAGTISQIRLVLGPNNSVVVGGVSYPLSTPSAQQSGLKLQVHQTFQAGVAYEMLLDFDANQSIVVQGNGSYQLKPVIRVVDNAISGAIQGSIAPIGTLAVITASSNGVAYSSYAQADGGFMIKGLPAGTYSVSIASSLTVTPVVVNNIVVSTGVTAEMGTVTL
jgi:hypothetical protein